MSSVSKFLSNGKPANLRNFRDIVVATFGPTSKAVAFVDEMVKQAVTPAVQAQLAAHQRGVDPTLMPLQHHEWRLMAAAEAVDLLGENRAALTVLAFFKEMDEAATMMPLLDLFDKLKAAMPKPPETPKAPEAPAAKASDRVPTLDEAIASMSPEMAAHVRRAIELGAEVQVVRKSDLDNLTGSAGQTLQ